MNHIPIDIHPLAGLVKGFIDTLLPPLCPLCRDLIDSDIGLCSICLEGIKRIEGPVCTRCGVPFSSVHVVGHLCKDCIGGRGYFRMARSFGLYEGILLDAIRLFKYRGKTSLAQPLAYLLSTCALEFGEYDLIIPIPLFMDRLKERGFNQSLLLSKRLGRLVSIPVEPFVLKKIRPSHPQVGLKRKERIRNVRGTFMVGEGSDIRGKKILLIDDVYTTGATAEEASRVLVMEGAEFVDVLTLGRRF